MNLHFNRTLPAVLLTLALAACGQQQSTEKTASAPAAGGQSQPGKGVSVQALQSPLSEESFQTLVVNSLL
ncbi:hypothetical protein, partial [Neisseria dentiae]